MHRTLFVSLLAAAVLLLNGLSSHCLASVIYYIDGPNTTNSDTSFQGPKYNTTAITKGIAFTAGSSGPFTIDTIDFLGINRSPHSAYTESFKLDLRNTTGTTPGSAGPGTTLYATDIISIPITTTIAFATYNLTTANLPNISAWILQAGQSYSLTFYSSNIGGVSNSNFTLGRFNPNPGYTTSNGFSVLNSTSGGAAYTGGAYSVDIGYTSAVPEPSTYALLCISLGVIGYARKKMLKSEE